MGILDTASGQAMNAKPAPNTNITRAIVKSGQTAIPWAATSSTSTPSSWRHETNDTEDDGASEEAGETVAATNKDSVSGNGEI